MCWRRSNHAINLLPELAKKQNVSQTLQILEDNLANKCTGTQEAQNEAELDLEICQSRAVQGHQGSNRSLRMGAVSIQPFWSNFSRRELRRHCKQLSFIQGELSRVCGVQHQPAPAVPVHPVTGRQSGKEQSATEGAAGEWDEEQKSANRECGPQRHRVATQGFRLLLFLIPLQGWCRRG